MRRLPVAAALFGLVACLQAQTFEPDTPYLYDSFEPQQKPWQPGRDLNIEEVFKNYQRLPDGGLEPVKPEGAVQ